MVEWKKLGEVCTKITDGSHNPPIGVDYSLNRMISSQNVYNGHIDFSSVRYLSDADFEKENKRTNAKKGDVVLTIVGTIGRCCVLDGNEGNIAFQRSVALLKPSNAIKSSFLMHYLINNNKHLNSQSNGGAQKGIYLKQLERILIPIPSLSEQNRIVGILDTFTASIDNLKEQIAQRRKQYEYYRDELLDLEGKEGVEMKIEDFCQLKAGKSIKTEDISVENNGCDYPCYGGNGIRGYVHFYSHDGEFPIIGRQGALCGCVNWAIGKFYATEHAVVAKGNNKVCQRFLLHLFQHANLNQYKTQGAQPGLSVAKLNEISFVIPSLQEQQRIVSILDTFEGSIQNLEAQLEQRQKQYEYYRNKLLTFE